MTFIRSHRNQWRKQVNPFLSLVLRLTALTGLCFSHLFRVSIFSDVKGVIMFACPKAVGGGNER